MEEKQKDIIRPPTTKQRILHNIRAIQSELELVRVHCIELEEVVMLQIVNDKKV